jgi:hypothetical protein
VTGLELVDEARFLAKEFYVSLHLDVVVISGADSVLCAVVKNGAEAVRKLRCKYRH